MENKFFRYLMFLLSLILMGLGISLVTKSNLGTSAISSLPYVLSLVLPFSFGFFTFVVNFSYFVIQLIFLKKPFLKKQYLQVIIGVVLGFFIDIFMYTLSGLNLSAFYQKFLILVIGCIVIGISIFIQINADIVNNPSEGMVKLIALKTNQQFHTIKPLFDIFLVILSSIISFVGINRLAGIGIGTIVSAILVGYVIKVLNSVKEKVWLKV